VKRKSIDAVPIWFVSKKIKPEKCITGDTLAPEKKALMITGDARGSQRVKDGGVPLSIFPKDTTSKLVGFFFTLLFIC